MIQVEIPELNENVIYFFKPLDTYGEFSQWYLSEFTDICGVKYNCAEQYMMYQKALLFKDLDTAQEILKNKDPKNIKDLGRKIKSFNETVWNTYKYFIVLSGNFYKFTQNKALEQKLLDTKEATLAEASPYDKIWGIGVDKATAEKSKIWIGENLLGKALMEVRSMIE